MGYGLEGDVKHAAGNTNTIEQAILPFLVCNDAKLVDGKVVGDPTEGALLVLGHKAKLDIEGTQAAYPRLATLPFDPTYKLMAVFADAKDAAGNAVVRAFVKGAGPAVIGRASSALANGETVPWGDAQNARADGRDGAPRRQGAADHGGGDPRHRPLSVRSRGRPALADDRAADDGDGRDDRPAAGRVEGRGPKRPERQHPRPDGDGRRRHHRRGDRPAARHRGGGDPRRRLRSALGGGAAVPHRRHRRRRPGGARAQGADGRDPAQEGRRRRDDRRRRQRRSGDQVGRHRHRDGNGHPGRQERRAR